jgi:hypothetical protein
VCAGDLVRIFAWVFGLALFGGTIVLAVAGLTAATAILVTAAAIVVMIGLGNLVGGRTTPNRAPYGAGDPPASEHEDGTRHEGGTMEP